ncbi:MAG: hypothetical protein L0Z62_40705 [Gemmataceae bacterium]|nr:hypothetical protein [Gemmataceae bacterium]
MGYLDLALRPLPAPLSDDVTDRNDKTTSSWDQAEAERLLAELRTEVRRLTREEYGGVAPALFGRLAADLLAIGEGYVRNHDAEAARGWDALALLREVKPALGKLAATVKRPSPGNPHLRKSAGTGPPFGDIGLFPDSPA